MSCNLNEEISAASDQVRAIPGILGLRPYQVSVRKRTWTGERVGLGTKTDADGYLTVADGYSPRVKQLTQKDIVASGGLYSDQDLEITITASYDVVCGTGGYDPSFFDPLPTSSPIEIYFKVYGPGLPSIGAWYKKISQRLDSATTYKIIIRKTGELND